MDQLMLSSGISGGARVYTRTQKGDMPMIVKDLVRLRPETVGLWTGESWQRIAGWSEIERGPETIELHLRSGEVIGCTPAHTWSTRHGVVLASDLRPGDILSAARLPAPDMPRDPVHLPGYVGRFVGIYLADGSRSGSTIQIASHVQEEDRVRFLKTFASEFGGSIHIHKTSPNGMTINCEGILLTGILDTFVGGKIANNKHLNVSCWQRNDDFLSLLLQGYLDGDGHYDRQNSRWRLGFTRNDALAGDLRTLCARLGISLRLNRAIHVLGGRSFPGYRGELRLHRSSHHNTRLDTEVISLSKSRARKFWQIRETNDIEEFALASGVLIRYR